MSCHSCTHGRRSGSRLRAVFRTEVRVSGRLGQLIAAELPYRALQPNRSVESTDWIKKRRETGLWYSKCSPGRAY
jgi:hypothetical protein